MALAPFGFGNIWPVVPARPDDEATPVGLAPGQMPVDPARDGSVQPTAAGKRLSGVLGGAAVGIASGLLDAAKLPGDVYAGRVDPMSDEGFRRAQDLAGLAMTGGIGGVAKEAGEAVLGSGPIRAYHGSPHDFDRFDIKKLGTGEGAQAYGHGLYFAEREGIAKSYRDALSPKQFLADGVPITDDVGVGIAQGVLHQGFPLDQIIENGRQGLKMFAPDSPEAAIVRRNYERAQELQNRKLDAVSGGHMYEVAIDANPKSFLDFDRPLAGQDLGYLRDVVRPAAQGPLAAGPEAEVMRRLRSDPRWKGGWDEDRAWRHLRDAYPDLDDTALQRVADGVERAVRGTSAAPPVDMNMTGGALLRTMNQQHGAAGTAGILHGAGIPGVRYLDAASRFGNDGTRNIVTFGDDLVSIVRKYAVPGAVGGGGAAAALGPGDAQAASPSNPASNPGPTMAPYPLSFGAMPAAGVNPADARRLFQSQPMDPAQAGGFQPEARPVTPFSFFPQAPAAATGSGLAGDGFGALPAPATPRPEADVPAPGARPLSGPAPAGLATPLPPARPEEFGGGASREPLDIRPGAQTAPAAPAAASGPSGWDRFATGIGDNADLFLSLGQGLLSKPGFGQGIAAGTALYQQSKATKAATDLARAKHAVEVQKLARDTQGITANAGLVQKAYPGLTPEQAMGVAANQANVTEALKIIRDRRHGTSAPSGYQLREDGQGYERISGGPEDPAVKEELAAATARGTQSAKPAEAFTLGEGQVRYDGENNVVAQGVPKPPGDFTIGQTRYSGATNRPLVTAPSDKPEGFDTEAKLRGEFSKGLGTFQDVHDGFGRVVAATQQREGNPQGVSPASDIALVFGYMKMLDPGSVVREGEYATAKNAAGVPERILNAYNKAVKGEFLTPDQRQDFVNQATQLYATARKNAEAVAGRYRNLAGQYGVDPDRTAYLPETPVAPVVGRDRMGGGAPAPTQPAARTRRVFDPATGGFR